MARSGCNRMLVVLLVGAVIALGCLAWAHFRPQTVAVVNGEKLTREQLFDRMYMKAGREILDELIDEILIMQEAKSKGVVVTEEEVAAEVAAIRDRFGSEEQFEMVLAQYGLSKEELAREIGLSLRVRKLVAGQAELTDEQVADYFEENKGEFGEPEKARVRHILVSTEEEARAILADLAGGADFAGLARAKSLDTVTKETGGDLGVVSRGTQEFEPEFEEAVFSLAEGETSGVVKTAYGFHIIRVEAKFPAKEAVFSEVAEKVRDALVEAKVAELGPAWFDELRARATITYILK